MAGGMASAKIINENNRRKYHGGVMAWRISNGIENNGEEMAQNQWQ
jgi:hypothetical protein